MDDCSKDRTAEIAREFENSDPRFVCISHEQNEGVGAATITGYKRSITDGMDIATVMAGGTTRWTQMTQLEDLLTDRCATLWICKHGLN